MHRQELREAGLDPDTLDGFPDSPVAFRGWMRRQRLALKRRIDRERYHRLLVANMEREADALAWFLLGPVAA
jgi:hypothetical protein